MGHKFLTFNGRVHIPVAVQLLDFATNTNNQDTKLDLDAVFAHTDYKFVIGGHAKVSFPANGERRFDETKVSLGYRDGKLFAPSLSYTQTGGDKESRTVSFVASSQPADTQYVAQMDYELGSKRTVGTVGLSYPLNDGAIVKAKLNSQQLVGLGYSKKISSSTTVDFGTLFQLNT